jgi:uncharacterized membrane protein YdjX (TVP38/TMEM64 family)
MERAASPMTNHTPPFNKRILLAAGLALVLAAGLALPYLMLADQPVFSEAWVRQQISRLGLFGPVALILVMALAIVVSPIPSGPIALAAGAIYGTFWGGSLVIAGSVFGASIAFGAARYLGFDAIRRSQSPILKFIAAPRSQWSLMAVVFVSRLVPFISFDAVSYAAGVTNLTFPRFLAATLVGIIPVCFLLAAVGAGLQGAEMGGPLVVVLGGITLVPIVGKWLWDKSR